MKPIVIEIAGKVEAKGRGRVGKVTSKATGQSFSTVFTPAHTRKYENLLKLAAGDAMGETPPIEEPVEVFIRVYLPFPKSASKAKLADMAAGLIRPCTKPDIDNYVKAALDGINTIVIRDDNQVWKLQAEKVYSDRPRLRIEVRVPHVITLREMQELD